MTGDLRVLMLPHWLTIKGHSESGIKTLVGKWFKYLPDLGVQLVEPNATSFDVLAMHAGMSNTYPTSAPLVSHLHGLYWTDDYPSDNWQHRANRSVIESVRNAARTTVPSEWVSETLRRDMRICPDVVGHGVEIDEWIPGNDEGYVLWNKNRTGDVCSPHAMTELARRAPNVKFLSTFANGGHTPNVRTTGVVPHSQMKHMVEGCSVYLNTTKETFGIGILEAMAAGKPVLGLAHGHILDLVEHGVSGYLANSEEELLEGLHWCLQHREVLGANARAAAGAYRWETAAEQIARVYQDAVEMYAAPHDVTVVVPCFNKVSTLERAVYSALAQTYSPAEIVVVDNNSTDGSREVAERLASDHGPVRFEQEGCQGVAHARNRGIQTARTRYVCCLDADDAVEPGFLAECVETLRADPSLGLAYTRLKAVREDGAETVSAWPGEYDFDGFLRRQNQVPTACVFRRDVAVQLGGYRQRFAPEGAGAEDVEFWLRMGASGFGGKLATQEPLFRYHLGGQVSGNPEYREVDWLGSHPWSTDGRHPMASLATPHNGISHLVRQYDQPVVSVVVPCAPYHVDTLVDALDSLEAQTLRKWEAIVVMDGDLDPERLNEIQVAYPHVRFSHIRRSSAGAARNVGASMARAKLLVFLDADDWLLPDALESMVREYHRTGEIVYGDYLARAHMDTEDANRVSDRIVSYNERTREVVLKYEASDFDCARAQRQPEFNNGRLYVWCLISSLVPKRLHDAIGGFDEEMESWEDWDYWIRMARAGQCFTRLEKPLAMYRFYTGQRRARANPDESGNDGRQLSAYLLKYLRNKYEGSAKMACGGCGQRKSASAPARPAATTMNAGMPQAMSPESMVWVRLNDGNVGDHPVRGPSTKTFYGYKKHGDEFKMLIADMQASPKFVEIQNPMETRTAAEDEPVTEPPPEPVLAKGAKVAEETQTGYAPQTAREQVENAGDLPPPYDFTQIWGIDEERAQTILDMGIRTPQGLAAADEKTLVTLLDVSRSTAKRILREAAKHDDEPLAL